jgi:lipoate-protein ligase B
MNRKARVCDLGELPYSDCLELQDELHAARVEGRVPDTLLLVEHEPVYTLGRNAEPDNLLVPESELAGRGIHVIRTGRGGQITFHGPGQLVGYPIVHLGEADLGAQDYVSRLEDVIVQVLARVGVAAGTDRAHRGVWIDGNKIAAIGVRISRLVAMHGFALNVDPDLSYYGDIVPCGIAGRGVTSLARLGHTVPMLRVKELVAECFTGAMKYNGVARCTREELLS